MLLVTGTAGGTHVVSDFVWRNLPNLAGQVNSQILLMMKVCGFAKVDIENSKDEGAEL
jgi:hypothetical protein